VSRVSFFLQLLVDVYDGAVLGGDHTFARTIADVFFIFHNFHLSVRLQLSIYILPLFHSFFQLLIDVYVEAVMGVDSTSARTMADIKFIFSNLYLPELSQLYIYIYCCFPFYPFSCWLMSTTER